MEDFNFAKLSQDALRQECHTSKFVNGSVDTLEDKISAYLKETYKFSENTKEPGFIDGTQSVFLWMALEDMKTSLGVITKRGV